MISTRYAFQRLKVKGRGSDFSAPPAYIRVSRTKFAAVAVGEFGSLEGSENRTELEAVRRGKVRTELGSELRGEKRESW